MRRLQPRQLTAVGLSVLTALFLVAPSSSYLLSSSGRVPKKASGQTGDMTQTLFCPLWRVDGKFAATINLKNAHLLITTTVIPTLYMADGTEYELPAVVMAPGDIKSVSVNDALATVPKGIRSHLSKHGSAALRFSGLGMIVADLRSLNVEESLVFNYSFSESLSGTPAQNTLEGLWWKHDAGARPFISVANATEKTQEVSLTIVGSAGSALPTKEIALAGHESRFLQVDELIEKLPSEEAMEGGIRIQYTGASSDIAVAGGLENREEGFSAHMPFFLRDHNMGASTELSFASTGITVGRPDAALGFPSATTFTPYLIERNTTGKPVTVAAAVNYMAATGPKSVPLPATKLGANESRQVPFEELLPTLGLQGFDGAINVKISYNGQPGDVQLATGSVDQTGTYVFEVSLQMVEKRTWGRDIPFWSVADGNDTMLSLWNPSDQAEDVMATFSWNGSSEVYHLPVHLAAMASLRVSLAELIASQTPDSTGTVIPTTAREGSIGIASLEPLTDYIHILVSAGIFNVKTATCVQPCICCLQITKLVAVPTPATTLIGKSTQLQVTAQWRSGSTSDVTSSTSYSSNNTAIATVQTSGGSNPGLITGVGVGSTSLVLSDTTSNGSRECYPNLSCPAQAIIITPPAPVAPRIDSVMPARGLIGATTASVTIMGMGFTGGHVNTPAAIQVSNITTFMDTKIVLDLVVSSTATPGKNSQAISVSVGSETSNAVDFFVQEPTSLSIVAGTASGTTEVQCTLNACGTIVRFVYQVRDQDSPAQPIQAQMSVWDAFANFNPDGLGLNGAPLSTTCTSSNLTNKGPCGVMTDKNGQFTEGALGACSTVCLVNNKCTTGGPSSTQQTWHVASASIVQQVAEFCEKVQVNGSQVQ